MLKYITLRNFVSHEICDTLKDQYLKNTNVPSDIHLPNDTDLGNVIYKSKRSIGLEYQYITFENQVVKTVDELVKARLFDATKIDFNDSISSMMLPFFGYREGGKILAHRGTKKELGTNDYQEYIALLQLTQRGIDFNGGYFYINDKATASEDGKRVYGDNEGDRYLPFLNKGDLIIFHNPSLVHGVTEVTQGLSEETFRLTCSWRANNRN